MDLPIKEVLKKYVKSSKIENGFYAEKIRAYWFEQMSPSISKRTNRITVNKQKLSIYLNSAPLKSELFNNRDKLKSLINNHLGEEYIREIAIY